MTELDFVLDRSGSMAGPVSAGYGPAGFYEYSSSFSYKKKNPNASPTWKIQFGLSLFGPSDWSRTSLILLPKQAPNR